MSRLVSLVSAVVLIGLMILGGSRTPVSAQDASPETSETGVVEGISFELTSFGSVDTLPPSPAMVDLYRVTIEPGASAFFPETDPGLGLHVVESGTLTIGRFTAEVVVTRAASIGTPGAQAQEIVPIGTDAALGPGDTFVFPPFVAGEWRNDSSEPVVLTVILIYPAGEVAATPTP
jgi:hypothetical protein